MKLAPNAGLEDWACVHWGYVGPGAPWQHTSYWEPSAEPETTEPLLTFRQRVTAMEQRVAELEAKLSPSAEPPSYEQAKVEHLRALTTLTLARAKATLVQHESLRAQP